jgi:hypothetical protein
MVILLGLVASLVFGIGCRPAVLAVGAFLSKSLDFFLGQAGELPALEMPKAGNSSDWHGLLAHGGGHGPQKCGPISMKDRTHGLPPPWLTQLGQVYGCWLLGCFSLQSISHGCQCWWLESTRCSATLKYESTVCYKLQAAPPMLNIVHLGSIDFLASMASSLWIVCRPME